MPTKIAALGIEFAATDQASLLVVLTFVNLYFLVTFAVYALADYKAWDCEHAQAGLILARRCMQDFVKEHGWDAQKGPEMWKYAVDTLQHPVAKRPIALLRTVVDIGVPGVLGIGAVVWLFLSR